MSEIDDDVKTTKATKFEKILEKLEEINKKLDAMNNKPKYTNNSNNSSDTYKNKRNVYVNKLNSGEIKQPKPETLEYYKVSYDSETKSYTFS